MTQPKQHLARSRDGRIRAKITCTCTCRCHCLIGGGGAQVSVDCSAEPRRAARQLSAAADCGVYIKQSNTTNRRRVLLLLLLLVMPNNLRAVEHRILLMQQWAGPAGQRAIYRPKRPVNAPSVVRGGRSARHLLAGAAGRSARHCRPRRPVSAPSIGRSGHSAQVRCQPWA